MEKFKPIAAGGLVALIACLQCGVALADDADHEARQRYENAVKLYEDGAYDAALVELNRAAELRPSYKIYYNIGQVRFAMHDYAGAMDAYRQYLDKGADKIPSARREQLQKELTALTQRVAKVAVETDVAGADVFIDDALIGRTPLAAPAVVNSGIRRITVRHPDYLPQTRRLDIAGGVQDKVSFALTGGAATGSEPAPRSPKPNTDAPRSPGVSPAAAAAVAPASVTPTARPAENDTREHTATHHVPWLGWAATGAFVAGAAVTGVLALSANSSLANDRKDLSVSSNEVDSKATKVRTLAMVSDGLAVAAVIAGGVSLWLTFGSSSRDGEQPGAQKAATKRLRIGLGLGGVSVKAAF